jgi:hypothetical protein
MPEGVEFMFCAVNRLEEHMLRHHILIIIAAGMLTAALLNGTAAAKLVVYHQFDFEPASGAVTQPGWTHVDPSIGYTASTAGFSLTTTPDYPTVPASVFLGAFLRPPHVASPPVPPPYDVRTDVIIGYGQGPSTPTLIFRDYIAPNSDGVSLTIYRDDPADGYPHSSTRVDIRIDGGAPITIEDDSTIELGHTSAFIHAPITFTMPLTEVPTTRSIDILFYDLLFVGDSRIRVDGIQILSLPEPSAMALLMVAAPMLVRRRKA